MNLFSNVFNKIIMNMNAGWFLVILSFFVLLLSAMYKKKISNTFYLVVMITLLFGFYILCFIIVPPSSFDLFRYYDELRYYRGLDFIDSINTIFSKANFVWYIILRVCALFDDDRIISFVVVTTVFSSLMYILFKVRKNYDLNNKQMAISIISFFSIANFTHTLSGLRNIMAVAIFSLGYSIPLFSNSKNATILKYVLMIISIFIHPMVGIFFIIMFLAKKFYNIKFFKVLIFFWSKFANILLWLLSLIPLPLFKLYTEKLQLELDGNFGSDIRILFFEVIQMLLIFYLICRFYNCSNKYSNDKISNNEKLFLQFFFYLMIFIIGSLNLDNIFIRCRFFIAYFIPLVFALQNRFLKSNKIIEIALLLIAVLINIYYIYYMMCNAIFLI